jgi:hypothetical protein
MKSNMAVAILLTWSYWYMYRGGYGV